MRLTARMLIAAAAVLAAVPVQADFDCPPGVVPLADATPVTGTGAVCYEFQIPAASPFVRFQVDAAGEPLDLYFIEGLQESLTDWDRLNVGPIQGDTKFVLLQPSPGDYTVAVVPEAVAANYSLSATAAVLGGDEEPLTVCTDDGLCSTAMPMKVGPQAIQLGSEFGDRIIFPLTVSGPGKIEVTTHWMGTAQQLALILNGPRRPELGNPDAYYARSDGASPLTLTYTVTAEDLEGGKRFQMGLVNFSGGEASGGIDIKTPKTVLFNYANLAKLVAVPVNPVVVQPVKPELVQPIQVQPIQGQLMKVKSQEEVCHEGVQGKIAWNYQGNKSWSATNVERLCKGTTKGSEPARCFQRVMHGGVNWGNGSRWEWRNAVDLCEGTSDALRTIRCFETGIKKGRSWQDTIQACDTQ